MVRGRSVAAARQDTAEAGWGSQTFHQNRTAARESPGKKNSKDPKMFGHNALHDVTKVLIRRAEPKATKMNVGKELLPVNFSAVQ